jgi:2-oxoglutarate dehydrogenase E2 component (dihydrolipoamide succinyltransferase)
MGESVAEATVTKWLKQVGDVISLDDPIVEIATDKVDTDITSEIEGILTEQRFKENEVVQIGEVLAVIEIDGETVDDMPAAVEQKEEAVIQMEIPEELETEVAPAAAAMVLEDEIKNVESTVQVPFSSGDRFYSPLVRNIAKEEGLTLADLDQIPGSGKDQRLTKSDLLNYLKKVTQPTSTQAAPSNPSISPVISSNTRVESTQPSITGSDQILEMSRMEKLIASHMKSSLETSAHVQSFIEVDVTHLWDWREQVKESFFKRENEKLTFTPLFMTAIIKALRDYPALNSSLDGDKVIIKKDINLGMATALPDGNLIVPVIKNADHLNLVGLTKAVNDLANRARKNNLKPEEIQNGTYTFTNIGNFGSIMGTPIINQPQVGILAIGVIRKMPAVIETPKGDFIGIRRKVILSHSYDHRIINGATGGLFVKRVAEYLENWDETLPF